MSIPQRRQRVQALNSQQFFSPRITSKSYLPCSFSYSPCYRVIRADFKNSLPAVVIETDGVPIKHSSVSSTLTERCQEGSPNCSFSFDLRLEMRLSIKKGNRCLLNICCVIWMKFLPLNICIINSV